MSFVYYAQYFSGQYNCAAFSTLEQAQAYLLSAMGVHAQLRGVTHTEAPKCTQQCATRWVYQDQTVFRIYPTIDKVQLNPNLQEYKY